jgi:hypothetical protein
MSRVHYGQKHLNLPKGDARCNPGPVIIVQKGNKAKKAKRRGLTLKVFLESKHITMAQFREFEPWEQGEWRRQHQEAHRLQQLVSSHRALSDDEINHEEALGVLADC